MPAPKKKHLTLRQRESQQKALLESWNATNPIGTLVSFEELIGEGETHRGRSYSEAQLMCGTAVVWLEGKSGCVCLDHCTAVAAEAVAVPVLKITLEDRGQDFTEWYVRDGIVIDCQPSQGRVWVGTKVTNQATLGPHGVIEVILKISGMPTTLNYAAKTVQTMTPEAATEVEGYGRGWADMMGIPHSDLGL